MSKLGKGTYELKRPVILAGAGTVVGPKEGRGPLGKDFDQVKPTDLEGAATWEKAESAFLSEAVQIALQKATLNSENLDVLLGGDLLNQLISFNFAARDLRVPAIGLSSACATYAEGLGLLAIMIDSGTVEKGVVVTSSHHDAAERQYRYPTELGVQRPPSSQWTVTGAGAMVLIGAKAGPRVTHVTFGKVVDNGLKDPNNMGAAMAPAAADTIGRHLKDTGRTFADYDLVVTGDLGRHGLQLAGELLDLAGYPSGAKLQDCGVRIYDRDQDVDCGGSGAACSAVVLGGEFYPHLATGKLQRLLFVGTGSLHSPVSYLQGESIPGIAHAVTIEGA